MTRSGKVQSVVPGLRGPVWVLAALLAIAAPRPAIAADDAPTESRHLQPIAPKDVAKIGPSRQPADETAPLRGAAPEPRLGSSMTQTILALAGVVTVILVLGVVVKRFARRSGGLMGALGPGGRAPSGVLEVLGRYPVSRGTSLVLLKMDRRILLLCQSGGGKLGGGAGMTTLCQVTDPEEVASLLLRTRDEEGETLAKRFQSLLSGEEKSAAEVLESPLPSRTASAITGPDSFELSQARAKNKPATAIRSRLDSLRVSERPVAGAKNR